jgi:hypothetical protein
VLPLILLTVLGAGSCAETVETTVTVTRSKTTKCAATVDGEPRAMNTYIIDVLARLWEEADAGTPDGGKLSPLASCDWNCVTMGSCVLVKEKRTCLRGPDRATGAGELSRALAGIRITSLDDTTPHYCVRVIGLELTASDAAGECPCGEVLAKLPSNPVPGTSSSPLRVCATNAAPQRLDGSAGFALDLTCMDDQSSPLDPGNDLRTCAGGFSNLLPLP